MLLDIFSDVLGLPFELTERHVFHAMCMDVIRLLQWTDHYFIVVLMSEL